VDSTQNIRKESVFMDQNLLVCSGRGIVGHHNMVLFPPESIGNGG
jgi:hypothetical protein